MAKSPDAFRTISEVSEAMALPAHVLRFWESKFTQIRPVKRAGGRRYYRPDDVALLAGIRFLLHDRGLTIKGAQRLIREEGVRHVMALGAEKGATDTPEAGPRAPDPARTPADPPHEAKPAPADPPPKEQEEQLALFADDPICLPAPAPVSALPAPPAARPAPRALAFIVATDPGSLRKRAARLRPVLARLEEVLARMEAAR